MHPRRLCDRKFRSRSLAESAALYTPDTLLDFENGWQYVDRLPTRPLCAVYPILVLSSSMQRFIESKTLGVYSFTSRRHFDSNDTIMPACCRAGGISASSSARIASTCISTVFGVQDEHNERCCGCYTRGGCRGDVQDYDDMALDSKLLTTGTCQLGSLQGGSRSDAAWELERINTNAASKAFAHTFAIDTTHPSYGCCQPVVPQGLTCCVPTSAADQLIVDGASTAPAIVAATHSKLSAV